MTASIRPVQIRDSLHRRFPFPWNIFFYFGKLLFLKTTLYIDHKFSDFSVVVVRRSEQLHHHHHHSKVVSSFTTITSSYYIRSIGFVFDSFLNLDQMGSSAMLSLGFPSPSLSLQDKLKVNNFCLRIPFCLSWFDIFITLLNFNLRIFVQSKLKLGASANQASLFFNDSVKTKVSVLCCSSSLSSVYIFLFKWTNHFITWIFSVLWIPTFPCFLWYFYTPSYPLAWL